jgi:septum site-determining protein MinD
VVVVVVVVVVSVVVVAVVAPSLVPATSPHFTHITLEHTNQPTQRSDADRVAGLLEANGIYNVKLLVNRVRPDMIQSNDMMSVKDVQEMLGVPLLGAIPEDQQVIVATNRGEPLVLQKKLSLSGIAYENAARRLIGKQDYFVDLSNPHKGIFQKLGEMISGA